MAPKRGGVRNRTQPSHYSPLPFHIIRIVSFIASLVVTGVMGYFMYHLKHDHFKIPWTFLILLAASLLTIISLVATTVLHCCHVLSPLVSLCLNAPLLLLWTLAFALLTWNMSGTLTHVCNKTNWGNSDGVMICRIYKALFSFCVIGWICAIASLALDIRTRRKQNRLGRYQAMDSSRAGSRLSEKPLVPEINVEQFRGESPTPGAQHHGYRDSVGEVPYQSSRGTYGREAGYETYDTRGNVDDYNGHDVGEHGEQRWGDHNRTMRAEDFGYAAPTAQTTYDGGYSR